MMALGESAANTTKRTFVTLFIPLFDPESGANRHGVLTQRLALVLVGLLGAKNPLIVTVPAVHGLVGRRETFVTGRRANIFDLVHTGHFLLVELRRLGRENLNNWIFHFVECHDGRGFF